VYGLGADALNHSAVARVYTTKGRPASNPLIIHVATIDMARALTSSWNTHAETLTHAFWPGPLTLVLPKSPIVPDICTAGGPNVAIRMPNHTTALALIAEFGGPLVGPSANPSGRISPTSAAHVKSYFDADEVFVLDGGPCERGIESTVISLAAAPRILRQGIIGAHEIEAVIATNVLVESTMESDHAVRLESPGTSSMHYAPRKPAYLVESSDLPKFLDSTPAAAVIAISDVAARARGPVFRMPRDEKNYAAAIYRALHEADASDCEIIVIEAPPTSGELWRAIHDRLARATVRSA
jgi:L-threonylcarbamoyladenylate synthase